ncbi:MAG: ABC transporter ATP-binding protein/permease [Ruminococcus sp.]|nr:ABC transporter ATP-binding protein/permease [Ruminococcus sp.]
MKSKEQMSKREQLNVIKRSILLIEKADKGLFFRTIISDVLELVQTYLSIYFISIIIDAISMEKSINELFLTAGVVNIIQLMCVIISRTLKKRYNCHDFSLKKNLKRFLWEKIINLDYSKIENPKTHNMYQNADRQLFSHSTGLIAVYNLLTFSIYGLIQIVIGAVLIFPIAFTPQIETTGLIGFVQSPYGLFSVLVLVILLELFKATYINNKSITAYEKVNSSSEVMQSKRLLSFFEWFTLDNYKNGKEIRIYNEKDLILSEYDKNYEIENSNYNHAYRKTIPSNFVFQMINVLTQILMYGFAIMRALTGMLSPSDVIAFSLYFQQIQSGISNLSDGYNMLKITPQFCKQIFDFLDIPDEKYMGTIPTEKRTDNEYEFEFKNVSFKYPNSTEYVLKNINLKWKIGEKMALVGKNGCGKSTLVKLLCRLYDPTSGEITLNGVDIKKYQYEEYMALFSIVFQDSKLFSFSMAENVASSTEYDKDYVEQCIIRSGLNTRLEKLSNGIETFLYKDFNENGVEISGGEAQKLILARALYKKSPFIILDEPTSALDPISEYDIYTKFNSIVGTKTAIYISHRLSSCRFCDNITVMENGNIVEQGTHSQLLDRKGVYYSLWNAQAEYYKDTAGELFTIHKESD